MTKFIIWDVVLALAGTVYLGLVLFQGLESPLFGFTFLVLAGCELVRLHKAH
ncbi:MAG TPA: hypothetical protein VGH38_27205 [Bryobacteraceae bacterium]